MRTILAIIAALQALAWLPVLRRFFGGWRLRKNPISLAICSLTLLGAYVGAAPYWVTTTHPIWVSCGLLGASGLVLTHFYVAFWLERKWYGPARKNDNGPARKNDKS